MPYLGRVRCAPKCADQCRGGVSTEGLPAEAIQGSNRAVEEPLRGGVSSLVCLAKGGRVLADSYHCSRYNTNTGRLTEAMFHAVIEAIVGELPPP